MYERAREGIVCNFYSSKSQKNLKRAMYINNLPLWPYKLIVYDSIILISSRKYTCFNTKLLSTFSVVCKVK